MSVNFPIENSMKKAYIPTTGEHCMNGNKSSMPQSSDDADPARRQRDPVKTLPAGDFPVFKETPKC